MIASKHWNKLILSERKQILTKLNTALQTIAAFICFHLGLDKLQGKLLTHFEKVEWWNRLWWNV